MSVTTEDIKTLRVSAGEAGDMEQARICDIAIGDIDPADFAELLAETVYGDADRERIAAMDAVAARAECERVIAEAAAQ